MDLAAAVAGHPGVAIAQGEADVIDARALSAYRARLADIDTELAIVSALARIERHDSSLARQLRDAVRTGYACRYDPDPGRPVIWITGR